MKTCFWILLLTFYFKVSFCDDLPCAARQTEFGAVCVCNSSYCDTVERPQPLTKGRYYQYTTSSDNPGFYRTSGVFTQTLPGDITSNKSVLFLVDPSIKYQKILGFGGAFTDAAAMVVDSLQPQVQKRFIESYFGQNGIEYSMGRVGVGMTDFSTRYYTYNNVQNDEDMVNFTLADEDYKYKIPLIQKAMAASHHRFNILGSAFTSPSWIQTINGSHSGYISQKHFQAWAKYHVKFLDSYAKHNITFWALTGGNQVTTIYLYPSYLPLEFAAMPYDHMVWLRDHLAPQLAASNHSDVKFLILDDMRPYAKFWMSRFARDPGAYELVEGVALHWYFDWFTNVSLADDIHHTYPDKLIVYTESSITKILFGGQSLELGSWRRAAFYAFNIIENLNHWTSGYLDWNLALNTNGGPYLFGPLDAPIIANVTGEEFYKNPMFYAMGHFSKFIPPGSRRVYVKSNQLKAPVLQETSFRQTLLKRLFNEKGIEEGIDKEYNANIITKTSSTTNKFHFHIPVEPKTVSCMATVNSDNSSSVIVFNGMDFDVDLTIKDTVSGYITTTLTANSLNTFVYWPENN